jgi:hypothetical protein
MKKDINNIRQPNNQPLVMLLQEYLLKLKCPDTYGVGRWRNCGVKFNEHSNRATLVACHIE